VKLPAKPDHSQCRAVIDSREQLTEPLTIEEIAVFIGTHWRGAKAFVVNADGVQCGSQWQIPLSVMPPSYFVARGNFLHISALSRPDRHTCGST